MKKDLSEFIKFAYKNNKVLNVSKAFEDNPVEEEWHKGKIENILNDKAVSYDKTYKIGDIVFVENYTYENGNNGNNHLFVIIDDNNMAVPIEYFGMLISSNLSKLKFNSNKLLRKDKNNNMKKHSIVKTDYIYKILKSQILFKIGKVELKKLKNIRIVFIPKTDRRNSIFLIDNE